MSLMCRLGRPESLKNLRNQLTHEPKHLSAIPPFFLNNYYYCTTPQHTRTHIHSYFIMS